MLDEAVHEMRGEEVVHDVDPELSFDVEALLPEDYVTDVGVRLSLYKRLASADRTRRTSPDIAAEMEDRFGPPPRGGAAPREAHGAEDGAAAAEGRSAARRTRAS